MMDARNPQASEDGEALARCMEGESAAYRQLVERYQRPLVAWLTGRVRDRPAAEDAPREAFVRAWFALGRFRRGDAFFPWLCGIAHQVTRETSRAQRRRERYHQTAGRERETTTDADHVIDEPDLILRAAIDALPTNLREIVLLRYYGECSCKEVAGRLNLPLGTVTKSLSRAHAMPRESMDSQAGESSHSGSKVQR